MSEERLTERFAFTCYGDTRKDLIDKANSKAMAFYGAIPFRLELVCRPCSTPSWNFAADVVATPSV
jgi:hypothetical protein